MVFRDGVELTAFAAEGWRAITENTDDTVLGVDRDGNIRFINRTLTPRSPEEVIGKSIFDSGAPATRAALRRTFDMVRHTGEPGSFEIEVDMSVYHPGLAHRWFVTKVVPVMDGGEFAGAVVMISDITDRKHMELRLRESEERWRSLTTNSDDTVIVVDDEQLIRYVNRTFPTTRPEDVVGTSIFKYVMAEHHDVMRSSFERVHATGETTSYETKLEMSAFGLEGPPMWFVTKVVPMKTGDAITGCILIANDITSRKNMENRLRDAEDKWRSLTDNSDDTIQIVDRTGIIRYINRTLPPTAPEDVIGTSIYGWVAPDDYDLIRRTLERVLQTGIPDTYETRLAMDALGLAGPPLWYSVKVVPTTVAHEVSGAILIATNITERKRYEDDLHRAKEFAEAANVAKSTFLANMSHEVRTPLNAIIGLTNLGLLADPSPKVEDYLRKVRTASRSLLGLINDILDFAKIEAGKMTIECVDFDLREVVEGLHDLIGGVAASKRLEWLASVAPDVPSGIRGDPLRLNQVLTNLVHNAVKFTEHGSISVRADKESQVGDRVHVRFSVQDTGIGIEPETVPRLFESFTQLDGSTTRKYGGSGLGLTICKHLVELMGGQLHVDSAPGQGSTFAFTLAFECQPEDRQTRLRLPNDLQGAHVLIVDNNPLACRHLSETLGGFGFRTTIAHSSEAAMQALGSSNHEPWSIIVLNDTIPPQGGVELARRIRRSEQTGSVPKIVMAVSARGDDVVGPAQSELDAVVLKTVGQSALFEATMRLLGRPCVLRRRQSGQHASAAAQDRLRGARILLVEDVEVNQQIVREILEGAGAIVSTASDGRQALQAVQEGGFDLVLMDVQMPGMDGFEATRTLRTEERFAELPVIAITAHAMAGDRQRCLDAGMNDHVTKPIDADALLFTLAAHLPESPATTEEMGSESLPPQSEQELPVSLPGFDVPDALALMGGDHRLLRIVLATFAEQYRGSEKVLSEQVDRGDLDGAGALVHALIGVSGNIRAVRLHASTIELRSCLSCGDVEAFRRSYSEFCDAFTEAMTSIETLSADTNDGAVPQSVLPPASLQTVAPLLVELAELLRKHSFDAHGVYEVVRAQLQDSRLADLLVQLDSELANLDYVEAQATLRTLQARIHDLAPRDDPAS